MATTVKTVAPSGMTLTRNNGTFTAKWKIGAKDYGDGQGAQYKIGSGKWTNINVGKTTTAKSFSVSTANFHPTSGKPKLTSVAFRVRGNQKSYTQGSGTSQITIDPTVSDWTSKTFTLKVPPKPKLSSNYDAYPKTTFSWTVTQKSDDATFFRQVEWKSILLRNSTITDGSKVNWDDSNSVGTVYKSTDQDAPTGATGSKQIPEDSGQLADGNSYTRWFRIRSRGVAGDSAWSYSRHVYAMPFPVEITDVKTNKIEDRNGYYCRVFFTAARSASRPVDEYEVQYTFAQPGTGMTCPSGASWQTGQKIAPKDNTGGAVFSVDSLIQTDQVMFVRVNATYDVDRTTYGDPVVADVGALAAPTDVSAQTDGTQYTATVTATNASQVADSFMVVRYYSDEDPNGFDIGVIAHGQTSVVVQCPVWSSESNVVFGVRAVVGTATATTRADGVSSYAVKAQMQSSVVTYGGTVPAAPSSVSASQTEIAGTVRVVWSWSWADADSAELSWADHADAWESTAEPSTYTVSKMHASAWNISGLATGKTWYIRVRLVQGSGDGATYGAYSATVAIDLASAPAIPVITLGDSIIAEDGTVTAYWTYASTDGTSQAFAQAAEVTVVNNQTVYTTIAEVETAQHVTISAEDVGWQSGETHAIAVRVTSESGQMSEWSDPVTVTIADPITCTITSTSLTTVTETSTDAGGDPVTYTVTALTVMPLSVTVTGAGDNGVTSVAIERAAAYHVDRPDETEFNGFEGETIAVITQDGEAAMSIGLDDLVGSLDDGAGYRLVATVKDGLGQEASASIDFEVHWTHQAIAPTATVQIDDTYKIALLTPVAPTGAAQTDVCDIYRLSVDKPELIYKGAAFGTQYVDPFPTIGEHGGHRFVLRTANGDYITAEDKFAWIDKRKEDNDILDSDDSIIDFGSGRVLVTFNVDLLSSWSKDFQETKYLGGSVRGDWNPAVSRSGSINAAAVRTRDPELIEALRRLAVYPGICHVRTKDGSSYPADVQVSESVSVSKGHKVSDFSLSITRVDPEEPDGLTYAEWQRTHTT